MNYKVNGIRNSMRINNCARLDKLNLVGYKTCDQLQIYEVYTLKRQKRGKRERVSKATLKIIYQNYCIVRRIDISDRIKL